MGQKVLTTYTDKPCKIFELKNKKNISLNDFKKMSILEKYRWANFHGDAHFSSHLNNSRRLRDTFTKKNIDDKQNLK